MHPMLPARTKEKRGTTTTCASRPNNRRCRRSHFGRVSTSATTTQLRPDPAATRLIRTEGRAAPLRCSYAVLPEQSPHTPTALRAPGPAPHAAHRARSGWAQACPPPPEQREPPQSPHNRRAPGRRHTAASRRAALCGSPVPSSARRPALARNPSGGEEMAPPRPTPVGLRPTAGEDDC